MAYRHRLIYQVWLVVINMKKVVIILSIISFLIGQTNPIDIATTGANKLRMHGQLNICLLYTSPSPRDLSTSRMPSSA